MYTKESLKNRRGPRMPAHPGRAGGRAKPRGAPIRESLCGRRACHFASRDARCARVARGPGGRMERFWDF
jgi:hypothetical protein